MILRPYQYLTAQLRGAVFDASGMYIDMSTSSDRPLLEVADRAELRSWLGSNHAASDGVRLAIGKKGGTTTRLTYDEAVEEALCVGWIDGTARKLDDHRYTVLLTPRRPGGTWARSNKERVARLSKAGLMRPAGLAVVEAAKADGSWDLLTDVEALKMPADLESALARDPAAASGWEHLAVSRKQIALYAIATAKRPETRAKRVAAALDEAAGRSG